jgi:hypothetical protein
MFRVVRPTKDIYDLTGVAILPHETDPTKRLVGPRRIVVDVCDLYETRKEAEDALGSRTGKGRRNRSWRFQELAEGDKVVLEPLDRSTAAQAARKFRQREKLAGRTWDFRVIRLENGQYALIRLR